MPVANKPILFYGLEALAASGLTEVGIVVGDTHQEIRDAVGDGEPVGRAGHLHPADGAARAGARGQDRRAIHAGQPFVMYLGDNLIREPLAPLVARFRAERPAAQILLAKVPNPQDFGVAVLEGGRVVRLVEKPAARRRSDLALVGVYMFDDHVFDAARAIQPSGRGELEITDAIQYLIDHGQRGPLRTSSRDGGRTPASSRTSSRPTASCSTRSTRAWTARSRPPRSTAGS